MILLSYKVFIDLQLFKIIYLYIINNIFCVSIKENDKTKSFTTKQLKRFIEYAKNKPKLPDNKNVKGNANTKNVAYSAANKETKSKTIDKNKLKVIQIKQ